MLVCASAGSLCSDGREMGSHNATMGGCQFKAQHMNGYVIDPGADVGGAHFTVYFPAVDRAFDVVATAETVDRTLQTVAEMTAVSGELFVPISGDACAPYINTLRAQ